MSVENSSGISRRGLMIKGAGAAAVLAAGGQVMGQERERPARLPGETTAQYMARTRAMMSRFRTRIGLQLYSVREDAAKDLPKVLAAVKEMGYMGVEFAGYYGRTAEQMKKLLDDNELECCGTHTGLDTLLGDNLAKTIEYNKTIGNKYLIVPGLPGKYTASHQAWLDTAKLFNELAAKVKPHDMQVGYHNHSAEFKPMVKDIKMGAAGEAAHGAVHGDPHSQGAAIAAIEEEMPWDTFMGNTSDDVIMQLDTGNCWHGGADPLPFVYRYPGRAVTVHLKEYSKTDNTAVIGKGEMPWRAFFALCRAVGGTEWYIVEHEQYGAPPLECVKACIDNLREMRLIFTGGPGGGRPGGTPRGGRSQ